MLYSINAPNKHSRYLLAILRIRDIDMKVLQLQGGIPASAGGGTPPSHCCLSKLSSKPIICCENQKLLLMGLITIRVWQYKYETC